VYEFTWNDVLFWTILCGLVTINALIEARFGRRRVLGSGTHKWTDQAIVVVKTIATFSVICVLWSFWSSSSLDAWFSLWPAALVKPTLDQSGMIAVLAASGLAALVLFLAWFTWGVEAVNKRFGLRCAIVLAQLFSLNAISISTIHNRLGISDLVGAAKLSGLNRLDRALLERGYYEDLLTVDRFGELAALYSKRPNNWISLNSSDLLQATDVRGVR
jgi:hypothetical protein